MYLLMKADQLHCGIEGDGGRRKRRHSHLHHSEQSDAVHVRPETLLRRGECGMKVRLEEHEKQKDCYQCIHPRKRTTRDRQLKEWYDNWLKNPIVTALEEGRINNYHRIKRQSCQTFRGTEKLPPSAKHNQAMLVSYLQQLWESICSILQFVWRSLIYP